MLELVLAVLAVVVASAVFSGTEAALFSLPLPKAQQLAEGSATGKVLHALKTKLTKPIATIVIGNNIANIVGTGYATLVFNRHFPETDPGWFLGGLTVAVILFSEILPKNIGERHCVAVGMVAARPVWLLSWVFTPVVVAIEYFTSLLVPGPVGIQTTNEEEITLLARIGSQEGVIEFDERQMIERVFRLNDAKAIDLMTPRTAITTVDGSATIEQAKSLIAHSPHSRIVVIDNEPDNVVGLVLKSKVLSHLVDGKSQQTLVRDLAVPVRFVHESTRADKLLVMFQTSHKHLAIVLDEHGGVSGLVTLEDVLEVLTGEIVDETDIHVDMQQEAKRNARRRLGMLFPTEAESSNQPPSQPEPGHNTPGHNTPGHNTSEEKAPKQKAPRQLDQDQQSADSFEDHPSQ